MDIQIFSDLHGEAYQDPKSLWKFIEPQAPVAVIAGDIDAHKFEQTLNEIASKFDKVITVLGNHEYYHDDISWTPNLSKLSDNITILNPGKVVYEGVLFIGATLWTDFDKGDWFTMNAAKDGINDFSVVGDGENIFTPQKAYEIHLREKAFIKGALEQAQADKIVVVSHFLPSYGLVNPKWKTTKNLLNHYFSANCDDLIEMSHANAWVFGHTHDRTDMEMYGVRCVSNPLGYPKENPDYRNMVISI